MRLIMMLCALAAVCAFAACEKKESPIDKATNAVKQGADNAGDAAKQATNDASKKLEEVGK